MFKYQSTFIKKTFVGFKYYVAGLPIDLIEQHKTTNS